MSFRLARTLSAALLSAGLSASILAAESSTLIWRGDVTTARGVVDAMAKTWEKTGHGKLELQPFNTASGIDAVTKGSADLAGSARGSAGGSESSLVFTPVAWDALVMVTNVSNPVSSLTLQQVHDIYYGKITNWSQVGGKDEPIDLYAVASPNDGVEYSLRRLVFGRGNQPVAAPRLYVNTAKLEEGIGLDPKGLGVSTMAGIQGNSKLKALKIDGVAPSAANIASGNYVLYTPLYLVTNPSSPKAAEAKAFIDFLDTAPAKAVLRAHDVLPYDEAPMLAEMDAGRRAKILAEVGAKAAPEPTATAAAAAPALVAARTPTPATAANSKAEALAARQAKAKEARTAKAEQALADREAGKAAFAEVKASAVSTAKPSLKGVRGEAITVSDQKARGGQFARVVSEVFVSRGKLTAKIQAPSAEEKPAASPVKLAPANAKPKSVAKVAEKPRAARTYKVSAGDTLYSIARKHDVDVAQVRAWNGMKDNTVRPGQVLRLSAR